MGKLVLYLAVSVDGYLADEQGGVGWLGGDGSEPENFGSYPAFYETVEVILMGWSTYHQIVTALSPDSWPYEGRPCYVVTHRSEPDREGITFWNRPITELAGKLKEEHKGNIWIHHPHGAGQGRTAVSRAFSGTASEAGGDGTLQRHRGSGVRKAMTADMKIREIIDRKKAYLNLLLLADEQEDMIDRYLERGTMYVLEDNEVKAECVVTDEGGGILELKNIAVVPDCQGKGYGKALVNFLVRTYREQYAVLQVGTGDSPSTIPFYEACGFRRHHLVKNFFTDHYDHPIYECGVQLVDMVYLQREL